MVVNIIPIKRSSAVIILTPSNFCKGTASKRSSVASNEATAKAINHWLILLGAWLANKITVAIEEGPANKGIAIGTIIQ